MEAVNQNQTKSVRVRIVKAKLPSYWYAGIIGEEIDVFIPDDGKDYVLWEDHERGPNGEWRHISSGDCEILSTESPLVVINEHGDDEWALPGRS